MSEQITTPEALDALPVGSVALDRHGYPWRKGSGSWVCTSDGGVIEPIEVAPLTVLFRPDAPTPTPKAPRPEPGNLGPARRPPLPTVTTKQVLEACERICFHVDDALEVLDALGITVTP